MKELYTSPKITVDLLEKQDVLLASGEIDNTKDLFGGMSTVDPGLFD